MMIEVELLTQLSSKMGTFCGGLDNSSKRQTTEAQPLPVVADVTLQYDDEEFWDDNPEPKQPRVMPPPPVELFDAVLKETYERISYHTTLASQALKELKAWPPAKESADPMGQSAATPARKGSKKLKDPANVSSVAKSQTKCKPKPKDGTPKPRTKTAPPQRPKTRMPRAKSNVGSTHLSSTQPHSNQAACSDMAGSTQASVIMPTTTQTGSTQTSMITTNNSQPSTQASVTRSKPPRPRKCRAAPAFPVETVVQQCSESPILNRPLTPM
ncbi:unnamed protein product [Calypogeia fissa]